VASHREGVGDEEKDATHGYVTSEASPFPPL